MPEYRITFRCTLLEDLHSGSGLGRLKTVDDCHARDAAGRPVVWYSMLAGLLRDAAEELRDIEPSLAPGHRIQRLFGAEGDDARSAVVCRSLHFDGDPSAASAGRAAEADPLFVNVTSTSREVHSRRPMEETLRTIEYAKAGLTAPGEIRFRGDEEDGQLLERCLRRLVALGGGRTRGAGRIRLSKPCVEPLPEAAGDLLPAGQATCCLRLVLKNLEPLCLPNTAHPGNILETETYLPGQAVRGALLTAVRATGRATDEELEALAASDGMQVSNGYFVAWPAGADRGSPSDWAALDLASLISLPIPLTAQQVKATAHPSASGDLPWWGSAAATTRPWLSNPQYEQDSLWNERSTDQEKTPSFKRIKTEDYLVTTDGRTWHRRRPAVVTLMRNRTPVARQKRQQDSRRPSATSDRDFIKADLFSEIALAEDQCFVCDLVFQSSDAADLFRRVAAPLFAADEHQRAWLRVGRGGRPVRVERAQWLAASFSPQRAKLPKGREGCFSLTLTSDLIARAPNLNFHTTLDARTLAELAGFAKDEAERIAAGVQVDAQASVAEMRVVHGFNTAAGTRRSPALAIRRGSAFLVKPAGNGPSAAQQLFAELEKYEKRRQGRGERIEEGFGRFALNHPAHVGPSNDGGQPAPPSGERAGEIARASRPSDLPAASAERERVIGQVLEAVGRLALADAVHKAQAGVFPGRSQWQALRHQIEAIDLHDADVADRKIRGILASLEQHASTLGGRVWAFSLKSTPLHKAIAEEVAKLTTASEQRTFMSYLCRWVLARLDRAADERRQEERGEEVHDES